MKAIAFTYLRQAFNVAFSFLNDIGEARDRNPVLSSLSLVPRLGA
jgi:hypothetical protein